MGEGGDDSTSTLDSVLYGLGILLGVLGSVFINFGNNLQALGMQRTASIMAKANWYISTDAKASEGEQKVDTADVLAADALEKQDLPNVKARPVLDEEAKASVYRWKRIRNIGTAIFIVGSLINFSAFALAPASVLAPLEAVQFITNVIFGKFVHGLTVTCKMKVGSLLTLIGTVIAVASGPGSVYELEVSDLQCFWEDYYWISWVVFANGLASALLVYWHFSNRSLEGSKPWAHALTLLPVTYALSSTLIGTQGVVQAKCLSEIVSIWLKGEPSVFSEW